VGRTTENKAGGEVSLPAFSFSVVNMFTMKLCELDLLAPQRSMRSQWLDYRDRLDRASEKHPEKFALKGAGAFGSVYKAGGKHLNAVTKIGRASIGNVADQDGYLVYVQAIVNSKSSNRHLPRIYDVRVWKDSKNRIVYKVVMEKLIDIGTLSEPEIYVLFRSLFKDENKVKELFDQDANNFASMIDFIDHAIKGNIDLSMLQQTTNEFQQAVTLIKRAQHQSDATVDIGYNNVMARRTPYGPQLVITDPLA
jgi:hypothetical protein